MKKISRQQFLTTSGKLAAGSIAALHAWNPLIGQCYTYHDINFEQQPLPYAYQALEPAIDAMTMEIHYSKHAAAYCKNLRETALAEKVNMRKPLSTLLSNISKYSVKLRNNGGGHYNHELFWSLLTPKNTTPSPGILSSLETSFGSLEAFKKQFSEAAKARFGSGWAWLVITPGKKLAIGSTPNQDNPLMDLSEFKGKPLLALDVWEHAYYLKYQNRRADYIDQFWKIVNWEKVQDLYEKGMQ